MYTLRLFHQTDPFRQLEARPLTEGDLAIGRETAEGWSIADPSRALSREHCVLTLRQGAVSLTDVSANGVLIGQERRRAPPKEPIAIEPGQTLRLGDFLIVVDPDRAPASDPLAATQIASGVAGFDAPFRHPILQQVEVTGAALAVPTEWSDPQDAPAPVVWSDTAGSLLDAFCAGAKLDASAFSGDDPVEIMRRLGTVYRQMVLGLGDLMGERTSVKSEYRMSRTTVSAQGNNPFKWAPPQRVAVDLLRQRHDSFLAGPQAVKASFEDLKKHLLCLMSGVRSAVDATLLALDPAEVEKSAKTSLLKTREAAAWADYGKLYAELRARAGADPDSPANQAFRKAYEQRLAELDALEERP